MPWLGFTQDGKRTPTINSDASLLYRVDILGGTTNFWEGGLFGFRSLKNQTGPSQRHESSGPPAPANPSDVEVHRPFAYASM
jgi:hypothetical protein